MAEAVRWGKRGARINTISPGIIITPLAKDELTGPRGEGYRRMIESVRGRPRRHAGRGRHRRRAAHGSGRWVHHRQRLLDGRRSDRRLLVRRDPGSPELVAAPSRRRGTLDQTALSPPSSSRAERPETYVPTHLRHMSRLITLIRSSRLGVCRGFRVLSCCWSRDKRVLTTRWFVFRCVVVRLRDGRCRALRGG